MEFALQTCSESISAKEFALQLCLEFYIGPDLTLRQICALMVLGKFFSKALFDVYEKKMDKWKKTKILFDTFRTESNGLREYGNHGYFCTCFCLPIPYGTNFWNIREIEVEIRIDPVKFHLIVKIFNFCPSQQELGWFPIHPVNVEIEPIPGAELDGRYLGKAPEEFPTFSALRTWIRELEHDEE
jgi:hypothetical protein